MRVRAYIEDPVTSLLDVGCNVGAWLRDCAQRYPSARLAGVEINTAAIEQAKLNVPTADLRHGSAERLAFPAESFQYVTCVEVLEHLPTELRRPAFQEMRRVLTPGGRLVVTVPHAGWFAWLDSNNVRYQLPNFYQWIVVQGSRDSTYAAAGRRVEWHHHCSLVELEQLAGSGWRWVGIRRGGLLVYPLMDWLSWPFYRLERPNNPVRRLFQRLAEWEYGIDFGASSYGVLIALERVSS